MLPDQRNINNETAGLVACSVVESEGSGIERRSHDEVDVSILSKADKRTRSRREMKKKARFEEIISLLK